MIHYYITDCCGAFKIHANYPFEILLKLALKHQKSKMKIKS
jgi:hypothetical protein